MKRLTTGSIFAVGLGLLAVACNPTVDPDATYEAEGVVVDKDDQPVANAEVRILKYESDLDIFEPSPESVFDDNPTGDPAIGFRVEVVTTVRTDSSGRYRATFLGKDIAKEDAPLTSTGVEGSNLLAVVRDPKDNTKASGVYTYRYVYQRSTFNWDAGRLQFWDSEAQADAASALTSGLVKFSWKKVDRGTSSIRNQYRIFIRAATNPTATLVVRCNEGMVVDGGCALSGADKVERSISAYTIAYYYSDAQGRFAAYINANSPRFRFVAKFEVPEMPPDIKTNSEQVDLVGVWAVGSAGDQDLLNTQAVDGNVMTREPISASIGTASAIYVQLDGERIADAGLLNSLVKDVANGCIVLESTDSRFSSLTAAKNGTGWSRRGKFCGDNGSQDEVSALLKFETSSMDGLQPSWIRLQTEGGNASFVSVGEVAVFKNKS